MNAMGGFLEDIKSFFTPQRILGLDIGTVSFKLVEVSRGKKLHLENYAILETKDYLIRGNDALQTSALKISEKEAVKLLSILVREMNPKTKNVLVSLPAFASFVVPLELPILSHSETAEALKFQARQYIPIPPSEAAIDWVKLEEFQNERGDRWQRILLIGVPNELIGRYKNIVNGAGLRLSALEAESLSLVRALLTGDTGITMVVDIGAESTNIVVANRGILQQTTQTDYGGVSLTQAMARSLDITPLRAEELKRRRGLLTFGGESELSTLILPFLDVIINEVRRAQGIYENKFLKKVEKVILCGGGANLPGLGDYWRNQTSFHIGQSFPFSHCAAPAGLEPILKDLGNALPVALGLVERYFLS